MIEALISGKVMGTPSQRTSKNGNHFTVAKVRVPTGEDATFCNVICFAESAQTAQPAQTATAGDARHPAPHGWASRPASR